MTEKELMQKEGRLFTDKQYRKCLCLIIGALVVSGLIGLSGGIFAIVSTTATNVIIGGVVLLVGVVLLLISTIFAFKYAGKIQLYRHYKKHPEDFENEV